MSTRSVQPYRGSYLMPSLDYANVADVTHPGIVSCDPDASVTEVARLMATHHVHCIAVMAAAHDQSGESVVWGMVSDLDLVLAGVRDGEAATARDVAGQTVITVKPTTPVRAAAALMLEHRVSHMVVVEPETQRPVGILSTLDIVGILAWGEA